MSVYYKQHRLEKTYVPDLLVFGEIIAELKSVKAHPFGSVFQRSRDR